MTTGNATDVSSAGAVLSGSFSGASGTISETGFYWGTSSSKLDNNLYAGSGSGSSGSFSKALTSLSPSTTYYYKAYVLEYNASTKKYEYRYGEVKYFTTSDGGSSGGGSNEAYKSSYLYRNEVPATSVSLSTSNTKYNGMYCHSTVTETRGTGKACIYDVSSTQRIVTHNFTWNGTIKPNYTMLYDYDKHCALWVAFEMGEANYPDEGAGRNESWGIDPAIPEDKQPKLTSNYSGSLNGNSYTRGHQAASNYRQTDKGQNKQTFYYTNMTPQCAALNNGSWNSFEQAVKDLADKCTGSNVLYVVTGPVFGSGYKTTTGGGLTCAVPTQYYTCLMKCTVDSAGKVTAASGCAYVFDHDGKNSARQVKSIDAVETLTGFDFFANIDDAIETSAEKSTTSLL